MERNCPLALRRKYSHAFHDSIETVRVCLIDNRPQGDIIVRLCRTKTQILENELEGFRGAPGSQIGVG